MEVSYFIIISLLFFSCWFVSVIIFYLIFLQIIGESNQQYANGGALAAEGPPESQLSKHKLIK